jgi:nitrite reductase/ring-hydroxylating ferredoxin subunit
MPEPLWTRAFPLADVPKGGTRTFKHKHHQLAVVRTEDETVFAIDNRCPHEGYPLAQGETKGCILTCAWHNWKFDLTSGKCILGGEGVRTYSVQLDDGAIHIDLAEPDPAILIPALRASLSEALFQPDNGRALRDAVRMLAAGVPPQQLLAELALYDALHGEYGTTHVLPTAADCGRFLSKYPGADAMYPIAQVIDLCGQSHQRLPLRSLPDPVPGATLESLSVAVEGEDSARAEGLLRGAFHAGVSREAIEQWLYTVMSCHFGDFGHQLIYLVKAQELFNLAGDTHAPEVYGSLVYATVLETREDTLPYMRGYFRRLEEIRAELPALYEAARADTPFDHRAVRDAVLDGSQAEAFNSVFDALRAGASLDALARALSAAAAQRLYRFDLGIERNRDVAETWLWATHRLTFASATRNAVRRFHSPEAIRFLVQALAFIHSGKPMDAPPDRRLPIEPVASPVEDIVEAIAQRDPSLALGRTAGYLRSGAPVEPFRDAIFDYVCRQDPAVRPIFAAHAVKTTVVAFEEHEALAGDPDRDWLILSVVRFLASPWVERQLGRMVHTSIQWVMQGVVPQKLTQ